MNKRYSPGDVGGKKKKRRVKQAGRRGGGYLVVVMRKQGNRGVERTVKIDKREIGRGPGVL